MNNIDITLIMGHTCVGKSIVAKELARQSGAYCYNLDDLKLFLKMIITDKMDKALVNALNFSSFLEKKPMETLVQENIAVSKLFSYALESIIAHNLHTKTKLILEGSQILPYLGAKKIIMNQNIQGKNIQSVLIVEHDNDFIVKNIIARDKKRKYTQGFTSLSEKKQSILLEFIIREKEYLIEQAKKYNINIIESRPFDTLVARVKNKF